MVDEDRAFLKEKGVNYPNVIMPRDNEIINGISGFPTTFFVDSEGTILTLPISGALVDMYEATVDQLLAGETVDTVAGAGAIRNDSSEYHVIVYDMDGQYNEQDNVANGYRLYCLTSNNSFSCGNLVPAAFRSSGRVTLIGQPTGGGSCVVQPCTTAAGTLFQISGNKQVSIIKNGSFYNTDGGIEPDFRLEKPESFYDRPALVEYPLDLK